ncbi:MAG: Rid family detoxifying hydrolase [Hyphomicrobiales bacterium]|nr:Rid family detoxifying hydrolase [Hyphomicrobiales bacterium]
MPNKAIFPAGAKPLGPYSPGIAAGDYVFLAGQIPIDANGDIVPGGIEEQTEQVFKNLKAVLDAAGLSFAHVTKATVFMANLGDFARMNAIYEKHVVTPYPARSTFQVAALPKGALVEIEMIAYRGA